MSYAVNINPPRPSSKITTIKEINLIKPGVFPNIATLIAPIRGKKTSTVNKPVISVSNCYLKPKKEKNITNTPKEITAPYP